MSRKQWVAYGILGAVGVSMVAGGAVATANAMELQTTHGTVVPGGALTNDADVLDASTLRLLQTDATVTGVVPPAIGETNAPAITQPVPSTSSSTPTTPAEPTTPAQPVPPTAVTPLSAATPPGPVTPPTPASAATAASAVSAVSN